MTARRDRQRVVHLSPAQIKVLAHPLRARLLGELRTDGPATATRLAETLATNTGATSYHLRQLAEVGLVQEDVDRSVGRQRWWRAAHDVSSWRSTGFDDDPDASAASDWLQTYQLRQLVERAEAWIAAQHSEPPRWREAAQLNDMILRLSADDLRDLNEELTAVVERFRGREPSTAVDVRTVQVYYLTVPRPGGDR
ncbi:helix-turn-helix domain-containing protein [Plantactinospora sp. GCM10030261]|uniref:helix-turn-helix domain-containing protein n=1 Tax=Plantactinospora sp. GCM10030261 TaxID=3273420 RepID=UPI0036149369